MLHDFSDTEWTNRGRKTDTGTEGTTGGPKTEGQTSPASYVISASPPFCDVGYDSQWCPQDVALDVQHVVLFMSNVLKFGKMFADILLGGRTKKCEQTFGFRFTSPRTPTASTLEAQRPATLAGYPSSAAVAKPFGCRGSFAACMTDNVHACPVLVESSACHVALDLTRAALQPELSRRTIGVVSRSMMIGMHLTTLV